MDVCRDPGILLFIGKSFHIRVLAVAHDPNEQECLCHLTGIRIYDIGRVSCPVYLDLLSGFSGDMHRCTAPLLVLLDVIAELGVHEGLSACHAAFLQIFGPEQLLVDTVSHQLLADILEIRHPLLGTDFGFSRKQNLLECLVRHGLVQGPLDLFLSGSLQDPVHGLL